MTINNSIKMFCSGTGLSYDEDNVSTFFFYSAGYNKTLIWMWPCRKLEYIVLREKILDSVLPQ